VSTNSKRPAIEICMRNNPISRVMQTDEPAQFGVSFFRTRQNLCRRYGRAIRGRKVDLGASIPANGAKRSRGQDVVGGLTGKPVMLEKSALPQITIAGPAPSPAMGNPETATQEPPRRKGLDASFATDPFHGSAGGSRQ
jgi:hypothetical protein